MMMMTTMIMLIMTMMRMIMDKCFHIVFILPEENISEVAGGLLVNRLGISDDVLLTPSCDYPPDQISPVETGNLGISEFIPSLL